MSDRKPLDPDCNGSVTCLVDGHVTVRVRKRDGRITWRHTALTDGQRKTLRERRAQATP